MPRRTTRAAETRRESLGRASNSRSFPAVDRAIVAGAIVDWAIVVFARFPWASVASASHGEAGASRSFEPCHLRQDTGRFFLERRLQRIVVRVGQFAGLMLEIQIPQVFVHRILALLQIGEPSLIGPHR